MIADRILEGKPYEGTREVAVLDALLESDAYVVPTEALAADALLEIDPYLAAPDVKPHGVGELADTPNLWVNAFIPGAPHADFGGPAFPDEYIAFHSLWNQTFGSPTGAQQFLAILDGTNAVNGRAREVIESTVFVTGEPALQTSKDGEAGFHADAVLRLHVRQGGAVRGGGGAGGKGACSDGSGKTFERRVGGGGGGAGAKDLFLTDPFDLVGGFGGINSCKPILGPTGQGGSRHVGGFGNFAIIQDAPPGDTDGTAGFDGNDGIILRMDMQIWNEGTINGGGGGGGGATTDGVVNESYPGGGGNPGEPGKPAFIRSFNPIPLHPGGAAGKAIDLNGFAVTWLADLDGTIGVPGDVNGAVSV